MKRSLIALAFAFASIAAYGIWVPPDQDVPISRLLANVNRALAKDRKNSRLHYLKARLHSLAFSQAKDTTAVYQTQVQGGDPVSFPPYATLKVKREGGALRAGELEHLKTSILEYKTAAVLDQSNGQAFLGLAWMHEEGSAYASQLKKLPWMKPATRQKMLDEAVRLYWKIYRNFKQKDLGDDLVMAGDEDSFVSLEAVNRIMVIKGTKLDEATQEEFKQFIAEIERKPRAVTPIIFPLGGAHSLSDLLSPSARVRFDIAGDDIGRTWSWVTPSTGILCWDPHGSGRITSGRQLFGSATFWMKYADGYQALASLDNDSDGWLRGNELGGISVWQDRDSDGVSDFGEVAPVGSFGVEAIRCKNDGKVSGMLSASDGILFRGGMTAPSYDWVTEPITEPTGIWRLLN